MRKECDDSNTIWRHLFKAGRCTTVEVERETGIDRIDVDVRCRSMRDSGHVKYFPKAPGDKNSRVAYGVTLGCRVPFGVKLKDILP